MKPELCTPDHPAGSSEKAIAAWVMAHGRTMGLVLDVGGYYKNVFTIAPGFDIPDEEIDLAVELLEQLFRRCAPDRT